MEGLVHYKQGEGYEQININKAITVNLSKASVVYT
jgi:hypothetical protein